MRGTVFNVRHYGHGGEKGKKAGAQAGASFDQMALRETQDGRQSPWAFEEAVSRERVEEPCARDGGAWHSPAASA